MYRLCLLDYANAAEAETTSPGDRSEIVFLGTGTSEGIPRVSCLTNPLKTCSVFILFIVEFSSLVSVGSSLKRKNIFLIRLGMYKSCRTWKQE